MKIKVTSRLILLIFVLSIVLLLALIILLRSVSTKWQLIITGLAVTVAGFFSLKSKKGKTNESSDFLDIGKQIFPAYREEFADFYNLYLTNKKEFLIRHSKLLKDFENFDLKNLEPIEVIYIFADAKDLVYVTDWRGQENEYEIQTFLENLINPKPNWTATSTFRASLGEVRRKDGRSAISLFKAIDKDLLAINQRLLFFQLNWDTYVYTVVPSGKLDEIASKAPGYFHGVDKIRD